MNFRSCIIGHQSIISVSPLIYVPPAVCHARYEEEEASQYEKLSVLIKDAVYLRVFIKTALAQVCHKLHIMPLYT